MRHTARLATIITCMVTLSAAGAKAAPQFSAIYAFGDSLSDAGNLYLATSTPAFGIPRQPVAPYSAGRFTNGNTWVQDLSLALGNGPLAPSLAGGTDYAFGGARTGSTLAGAATLIDLPSQLAQFGLSHPTAPSNALYTLSIGANDIFGALTAVAAGQLTVTQAGAVAAQAASNAAAFVGSLTLAGARQLILYDVPNLADTPGFRAAGALATALAAAFNTDLQTDLAPAEASGLQVHTLGEFARIDQVVADPGAFGFSNATDPCWTGNFTNAASGTLCSPTLAGQDQYLFWDAVHPTEAAHLLVAEDALASLPEPAGAIALLAGVLGMAGLRRRFS